MRLLALVGACALLGAAVATSASPRGVPVDAEATELARAARALLAARCFACHGPDAHGRKAELRLDTAEGLFEERGGSAVVVRGDAAASLLLERVRDEVDPMPPAHSGAPLDADEVQLLARWIDAGAQLVPHWAFVPPEPSAPPALVWPGVATTTAIDAFVLAGHAAHGLAPNPEAPRRTLLRRVALDLVGLPPDEDFLARHGHGDDDASYEAAVDELLASPHFGERWASVWLDLARYADSAGYGSDPLRTIWPYRDWVIEAFDANMPFDRFATLQLAGDLVPDATDATRLATAFHRNTLNNTEGGTDDEEFRVAAVKDRVDTTMQVFTGLTTGCARCHDHKFDPLAQAEYYALFDVFNQTADADTNDEAPLLDTPTAAERARRAELEAELARLDAEARARVDALAAAARGAAGGHDEPAAAVRLPTGATRVDLGPRPPRALVLTARLGERGTVGGSASGNAVLSEVRLLAHGPRGVDAPVARVRIELPGRERILSLAEVVVYDAHGEPVAAGRARQSSTAFGGPAELARDGRTSGSFDEGSVTHSATEDDPWWELELDTPVPVRAVSVHNRTDGDLARRLRGAEIVLVGVGGDELLRAPLSDSESALARLERTDPVEVPLVAAAADFAQAGWPAAAAVDGDLATGWALAPRTREEHALVLVPGPLPAAERYELELLQEYGTGHEFAALDVRVADGALAALELAGLLDGPAAAEVLGASDPELRALAEAARRVGRELADLVPTRTPVLVELPPEQRRATHVHVRGDFRSPGEQVFAGVPRVLALDGHAPTDRLAFARWLFDPRHPLTARVTVNRFWARLFGRGLVASEEDFGLRGAPPTHPELLDWLAVEFVRDGHDVKALLRTIVTSRTYRQESAASAEAARLDPLNQWLARGPRQRLEAEMVRDSALAVSGLLARTRGGPPVFPPQPDGLWRAAFNGERTWETSTGSDRYRRDVYTFLRRTIPYHTRTTFDGTSRETCTLRRVPTNTPLQALVKLNDPVFVECAQALGRRALDGRGTVDASAVARCVELALCRPPTVHEAEQLAALCERARAVFARSPADAAAFATVPLGELPNGLDAVEAATATLLASTVLNLDDFLTRE
jgi:mono/diheme cytochrome c family protein